LRIRKTPSPSRIKNVQTWTKFLKESTGENRPAKSKHLYDLFDLLWTLSLLWSPWSLWALRKHGKCNNFRSSENEQVWLGQSLDGTRVIAMWVRARTAIGAW
jgi:hypothetical protein